MGRLKYARLSDATDKLEDIDWHFLVSVAFSDSQLYEKHLYIGKDRIFSTAINAWYAWLRNLDRKPWSLCIPYRQGGKIHPMYPDMLIAEKTGDEFAYSILEPHDPSRADNVTTAVGLAEFAEKHKFTYHRIQLIRKKLGADHKEHFYWLDMAKVQIRNKVKAVTSDTELDSLFKFGSGCDGIVENISYTA